MIGLSLVLTGLFSLDFATVVRQHFRIVKYFLNIAIIALSTVSFTYAKPSCAILPFEAGAGFTEDQAAAATAAFRSELEKTGEFDIVPENITKKSMDQNLGTRPASITPYYLIAGRILKVDYVITGITEISEGSLWLNTDLCDINRKTIRKRVKVYYKGDVKTFLNVAPESNVKQLLKSGIHKEQSKNSDGDIAADPRSANTEPVSPTNKKWDYDNTLQKIHEHAHDNVQVGARVSYYKLMKTEKESFLGSINKLKEEQDFMPRLFARAKVMEPFWITLGYDQFKAKTWTEADPAKNPEGYTDGTIELAGPYVLLHMHTKKKDDMQWFAEIGFALYGADFIHDPAWRDSGYANSHIMVFEDTVGVMLNGGCDLDLTSNLSMSVYAGYTRVTSDMTYYLNNRVHDSRTFPLSNLSLGLGLQYRF